MTEADEQLSKCLGRLGDKQLKGVDPPDVVPSIHPGYVVLKKRCGCGALRSPIIYGPDGTMMGAGSGFHHHLVKIPEDLWKQLSEERGWPQNRWIIQDPEAST